MQKVMLCTTMKNGIRSDIHGWDFEDADEVINAYSLRSGKKEYKQYSHPNKLPVGLINSGNGMYPLYPTVLHALGDGWKLLAPPTSFQETHKDDDNNDKLVTMWEWWLVRG